MGMTVDEALAHAKEPAVFMASADIEETDLECMRALAAEVERLRDIVRRQNEEIERLQKVVADQALTIGTLKDELAGIRAEHDRLYPHGVNFVGHGTLYGTEETCKLVGGWIEQLLEARQQLKRFTDREPLIDAIKSATIEQLPKAVCDLEVWEQEHPV